MAKFGVNEAEHYGGQGGGGYFSLKNDKDVAKVRFLYDSIDDVEGYAVHEVEIDGKKRYVNCLREYGQSKDVCPFCSAQMPVQVKYFVPIYDVNADKVLIWERGKKFGAKLSGMCARYPHLVQYLFEIERNGAKGDTNTTYEIWTSGKGEPNTEVSVDDFDLPNVLGGLVLDKDPSEMDTYLNTGSFEDNGSVPFRRRGDDRDDRRTPANTQRETF